MERPVRPKAERTAIEGWEIFNDDAAFNAHAKGTARLPLRPQDLDSLRAGQPPHLTEEKKESLAAIIAAQQRAKKPHTRPCPQPGQPGAYVNESNRAFNQKLNRFFASHVRQVKNDIERPLG